MKSFHGDLVRLRDRLIDRQPTALVRFGDGELAILDDRPIDLVHKGHGEFRYRPHDLGDRGRRQTLLAALHYQHPDYWVGIVCPCCGTLDSHRRMLALSHQPASQLTWANLLVNANYGYFCEALLPRFGDFEVYLVCHRSAKTDHLPFAVMRDWRVGPNAWSDDFGLIQQIAETSRDVEGALFLCCAGPFSNLLIHHLFRTNPRNLYLNVGSTLDPFFFGQDGLTREYLRGGKSLQRVCRWGVAPDDSAHANRPEAADAQHDASKRLDEKGGITAVLTVYRRPQLLARQIEALRGQSVPPAAIWLWANEPNGEVQSVLESVRVDRVISSSTNARFHGRFALALMARTEYVAIFDDDAIPGTRWLENCLATMQTSPGILGSAGVRLTREAYQGRSVHGWHDPSDETIEVDLVGHAWFLKRDWVHHLFAEPAVTAANGEDIELSSRAWRLGAVRTYCPPHPPGDIERWGSTDGARLGSDEVAASRAVGHTVERDTIVRAEIAAGWQPLYLRARVNGKTKELSVSGAGRQPDAEAQPPDQVSLSLPPPRCVPYENQVLELVPQTASRVLVAGRGAEVIAHALRDRQDAEVIAVPDRCETRLARNRRCDGSFDLPSDDVEHPWDVIVLCQQIERCDRPIRLLESLRQRLSEEGILIIACRNLRYHRNLMGLLAGRWQPHVGFAASGRFFTRRELEKACHRAGFEVSAVELATDQTQRETANVRRDEVKAEGLHIGGLAWADVREFYAEYLVLSAKRAVGSPKSLTSIVLVTHNQLPLTQQCLESIRFYTDGPYELIVVDNASTDGTLSYLEAAHDVRLIANGKNRGFPAAANQGIQSADGEQILLLNNDTLVTTGWLGRMLAALDSDSTIGLVGPYSNRVSGYQQIPAGYENLSSLDGFAWQWSRKHRGSVIDVPKLIGFCLLIRREVVNAIGLLDEQFGLGNFEDDDYCRRAQLAGYRTVIAEDAFVHHFGSQTFLASGVDFSGLLRENEAKFLAKWPPPAPVPAERPRSRYALERANGGGLRLTANRIKLSLIMIVRNNEETVRPCLESIRPWVDEMVVVDTGSTDHTPTIARELGARLFEFPWCDDFSAARNESIRHARGEWVFWMDSDDTIPGACGQKLRDLIQGRHDQEILGYIMQVHCPGPGAEGQHDVTVVDHVKLFRNLPELRFEHRIHEQIIPAIRRAGGEVAWTDIYVVHSGSDHSPAGRARKIERDLRILDLEIKEHPNHPFVLFNLGMTYADIGQHQQAVAFLARCLEVSTPQESHVRKAYALAIGSLMQLERFDDAEELLDAGRRLFPRDPELRFREGILAHQKREFARAEVAYLSLFNDFDERHFTSVDQGICGYKARHNLALVYTDQGKHALAAQQWRLAVAEVPSYREGWRGLGQSLVAAGSLDDARSLIHEMSTRSGFEADRLLLEAGVVEATGRPPEAAVLLRQAIAEDPSLEQAYRGLARLLFEQRRFDEAIPVLEQLTQFMPDDAAAHSNLGLALAETGDFERAAAALETSLALRPESSAARAVLASVRKELCLEAAAASV